jgi:hypothetical protein
MKIEDDGVVTVTGATVSYVKTNSATGYDSGIFFQENASTIGAIGWAPKDI